MRLLTLLLLVISINVAKGNDSLNCTGKLDDKGRKNGVWICRDNAGKLLRKERFKHGEISTWINFNAKGEMIESRDRKGKIRKYQPCGC